MRNKIITVCIAIITLQIVAACCPDETFEYTITAVNSRTIILEDNRAVEVGDQDTIAREDLILEAVLQGDRVQVADVMNEIGKLGVQSTYAAIDCDDATIIFKNNVQSIEVSVIDISANTEVDITNDIVSFGDQLTLAQYIAENNPNIFDSILLEFSNTSNIPSSAQFRIRVLLDDNTVAETVTNQVNFN